MKKLLLVAINETGTCVPPCVPPTEVMDHFIREVGANALNYQHADDISECISVLDSLIKEQEKNNY